MNIRILAPAAVATLLATSALAPVAWAQSGEQTTQDGAAAGNSQSVNGYVIAAPEQVLATGIIGQTVFNASGEDAEAVGEINDVVMSTDGSATALVIGVGGFLGIGQKEVALDFSNVNLVRQDGETVLTTSATRADLEAAPSFERAALEPDTGGEGSAEPAGEQQQQQAPAEEAAPAPEDELEANTETPEAPSEPAAAPAENGGADGAEGGGQDGGQDDADEASGEVIPLTQLSTQELMGARVYSADGRDIGEINDVLLSEEGAIQTYLVDVGGFLGIGEKQVALGADELTIRRTLDGWLTVQTPFTQEELEAHPAYSEDAYTEAPETITLN